MPPRRVALLPVLDDEPGGSGRAGTSSGAALAERESPTPFAAAARVAQLSGNAGGMAEFLRKERLPRREMHMLRLAFANKRHALSLLIDYDDGAMVRVRSALSRRDDPCAFADASLPLPRHATPGGERFPTARSRC